MSQDFNFVATVNQGDITTNIEKIRDEVRELIKPFEKYNVTDETMVSEGKEVRSKLNKIYKIINDEKKRVKKQFMEPYNQKEEIIKEVLEMIKKPSDYIDMQIKVYEEQWRDDKKEEIQEFFDTLGTEFISLDDVLDKSWLNKTTSTKKWQSELTAKVDKINTDLELLRKDDVDYTDELIIEYLNNDFDKDKARERYHAKQEMKQMVEDRNDEIVYTITLRDQTTSDLLETFLTENNIEYKRRG